MDPSFNQKIKYEISILKDTRSRYARKLDAYHEQKNMMLRRSKNRNGHYYYYAKRPGKAKERYLGTASNPEVIRIREVRFIEEAISRIDHNLDLLESLSTGYLSCSHADINKALPAAYRNESPPVSSEYEAASAVWKAKKLEFQKRFPENYPHRKTQRTSDGVMVKTISELLLYEMFKSAGLTQIYELPFPAADYGPPMYPDFTILSPIDMKTEIIVEFVGRLDQASYREDFAKKTGRYIASGYTPGVDLFFIFNDRDGNIDSLQVDKVIADILGIRG